MFKRLSRKLGAILVRLGSESTQANIVNLEGDRDIEWSWVAAEMPKSGGKALDFGPGGSNLGLIAARCGFAVTSVDLEPVTLPYIHPGLQYMQGDILTLPLSPGDFDLVINCSVVEHVGLAGRYGVVKARPDGDLEAMARLRDLMKPGGRMLMTIPVGRDRVFMPLHRVYGPERLPALIKGYQLEKEEFWIKKGSNQWIKAGKEESLAQEPQERLYGLGCFVLLRP